MGIDIGGSSKARVRPAMNITPLVDVVLVLLIIFMVVTPLLTKQFWINTPKSDDNAPPPPSQQDEGPVVLSVDNKGLIRVNSDIVERSALTEKLKRVLAARSDRTVFFMAHDDAPYGAAVETMDYARSGGAITIAVVTDKGGP